MKIIRSEIFSHHDQLLFGMSTRNGGLDIGTLGFNLSYNVGDHREVVTKNRELFFSSLNISQTQVAFPQQQHTDIVNVVSAAGSYERCDALVTGTKNLFIAVSIADCTPVMLFDPVTKTTAGIHAGWRGTASKIVKKTIAKMFVHCGVTPENIIAFIGPSAGKCCYEVGDDVAQKFSSDLCESTGSGKFMLDIKTANKKQLLEAGVQENNIEVHSACTISTPEIFHSFRRDGNKSGRMLAVIGMTS